MYTIFQGAEPNKATPKVVLLPEQMVAVPLIVADGKVLTTTGAVPEIVPEQLLSVTLSKVYVLLDAGLTVNKYGPAANPVTLVVVVPSV